MYQRYAQLIPVLILLACCISTIITAISGTVDLGGDSYDFALSAQHYGAFGATAVSVFAFFWFRNYYKYCLALLFVLGATGLINFTALQRNAGLLLGELHVGLSPLMLVFGLAVYCLNTRKINAYFFALAKPSDKKIAQQQREQVAEFKSKFSRKPTEELEKIVADNKLVIAALAAARQLLQERNSSKALVQ